MRAKDIPNAISLLRVLLVPPLVFLLDHGRYSSALLLFAVAGVTDALDGYLAKHFGWSSRLGSILDPLADKLLLVCSYLTLGALGQIPAWLVTVVIGRDIVIIVGGIAYHFKIRPIGSLVPSPFSKLNTLAQILLILAILLAQDLLPLPQWLIDTLVYTVLVTTLLSGLIYIWTWGAQALREARGSGSG